jgi:hypothetical protein
MLTLATGEITVLRYSTESEYVEASGRETHFRVIKSSALQITVGIDSREGERGIFERTQKFPMAVNVQSPYCECSSPVNLNLNTTTSRRLVRRKGASWSLNWPSGANLLAHLQLECIPYVPL